MKRKRETNATDTSEATPNVPFPFLRLPPELRLEVYRHLFCIYPWTRASVVHPYNCAAPIPLRSYEICAYPRLASAGDYHHRGYNHEAPNDRTRLLWKNMHPCQSFLAILSVSKAIYSEAMPLFYSETFFDTFRCVILATTFLKGIGQDRRRYVRQISFEYADMLCWEIGGRMKDLVDNLVVSKRVTTVEIVVLGSSAQNILDFAKGKSGTMSHSDGKPTPYTFEGLEELERLEWLGTLRMVGNWQNLLEDSEDRRWLQQFAEGKKSAAKGLETKHKPTVVIDGLAGIEVWCPPST